MKKLFVAVALVMGLGTSVAVANTMMNEVEVSVMVNEFTPVEVKDLPKAVQDAVAKAYPESSIKEASVEVAADGASKHYKLVLIGQSGTDTNETTVFFGEDGTEVKQNYSDITTAKKRPESLFFFSYSISKPFQRFPLGRGAVKSITSFETG